MVKRIDKLVICILTGLGCSQTETKEPHPDAAVDCAGMSETACSASRPPCWPYYGRQQGSDAGQEFIACLGPNTVCQGVEGYIRTNGGDCYRVSGQCLVGGHELCSGPSQGCVDCIKVRGADASTR